MQFCWIGLQIEAKNAGAVVLRRGFSTEYACRCGGKALCGFWKLTLVICCEERKFRIE
jgi:hypothetical protein